MSLKPPVSAISIAFLLLLAPVMALAWQPYPPYAGYLGAPTTPSAQARSSSMRIERQADPTHYRLVIHLSGIKPDAVKVNLAQGRWLVISTVNADQMTQENTQQDGSGFYRSFSYRSSQMQQQLSLPRDADARTLQRTNEPERVIITFARRR